MDRIVITADDEIFLNEVYDGLAKVGGQFEARVSMPGPFELLLDKQELLVSFTQGDDVLHAKIEDVDKDKRYFMSSCEFDGVLHPSKFKYSEKLEGNKEAEKYMQEVARDIGVTMSLFFYVLNNYKDYSIITEKEVTSNVVKTSKAKKGKRPTKKIVRVVNKVIRISRDEDVQKSVKRSVSRVWHVDEYGRRGHWRTYKSGKRVWIAAQTIKTGANTGIKDDKEYRL